ncbi:DUF2845 domain-containing protein [Pseudomonas sp. Gutcm_11s]|uniref:DUF2845 domain-containing protein n=1 Tax=Pseudomonas sp. Gutcm_11s TaxID=3026088 RepID=UPI002362F5CC|nr:DUF2845 domain-containing protein [Pseudomonas sp. Gutcm_11s]MDD0844666.1 DUF2845 domain-containing protein [Pseudomonas sp. Gutcm_11s]
MYKTTLLTLSLLLSGMAEASSTLRCGSRLISTQDLASEIEAKCGEPASREFLGYREVTDYYGTVTEVAIEEWVYGPKNGMYYFLRLEGNRLVKIESKRGD